MNPSQVKQIMRFYFIHEWGRFTSSSQWFLEAKNRARPRFGASGRHCVALSTFWDYFKSDPDSLSISPIQIQDETSRLLGLPFGRINRNSFNQGYRNLGSRVGRFRWKPILALLSKWSSSKWISSSVRPNIRIRYSTESSRFGGIRYSA